MGLVATAVSDLWGDAAPGAAKPGLGARAGCFHDEQNVDQALEIANHANVIEKGRITLEGAGRDLPTNSSVCRSFLGL
jgi:ABC-type lipopolysaccharide export system ATPase subunit